jgi:hypothetical protein
LISSFYFSPFYFVERDRHWAKMRFAPSQMQIIQFQLHRAISNSIKIKCWPNQIAQSWPVHWTGRIQTHPDGRHWGDLWDSGIFIQLVRKMSGPCNWPCWKWRIRDPSSTCVCPLDSYGWVIRTFCAGMNISNWVDWTTKMTRWNSPISPSPSSIWTRMWRWRCENDDSKRQNKNFKNKNNNFRVMNRGHFFFYLHKL